MGRFVVIWVLAAVVLSSMRLLAAWGAKQDPGDIPDLLRVFLPDAPPAQNSELSFDPLFHHFGTILEGEVIETEFPFVNEGDVPVTILRARHCGCVKVEFPRDTPIAPGESAILKAQLNSNGRTGVQVKPIELFTDEEGEGPHTGILLKGSIISPLIFRRPNVVWMNANPGESREWRIAFEIGDKAGEPELVLDSSASFVEAKLELDGDEGGLVIDLRAPASAGTVQTDLMVRSRLERGDWEGTDWTKAIPVRITVRAAFRVLGKKVQLSEDGAARVTLNLSRHDQVWIEDIRIEGAPLTITRILRGNESDEPAKIQKYTIARSGDGEIPPGTTVDVWSNLSDEAPVLRIPLLLPE